MLHKRSGKSAGIVASGIVIAGCLAIGDLLLPNSDGATSEGRNNAGSLLAATTSGPSANSVPLVPTAAPVAVARGHAPPQAPAAGEDSARTCTFDATVYEVRIPPGQISRLDMDALTKAAATPEAFEKALAALGPARPLYRANQSTNFNEEQYLKITNETPYATPSATQPGDIAAFNNTSASFDLIAKEGNAGTIMLQMAIKASILLDPPPTAKVQTPVFRTTELQQQRSVTPGKPFIFVSADATSLDADGKAVAFITRVTLSAPPRHAATQPAAIP